MNVRLFAILAALFAVSSFAWAQPKLVVEKDVDMGTVFNGATAKAKVRLTNGGTAVLKITSVRTSCSCTTVKYPKSELAPGESDDVEVEFNSTGVHGNALKYLNIDTNDPTNEYATVTLHADVREELQPTNSYSLLWFGEVLVGKQVQQNITFLNISNSRITIRGVSRGDAKLAVRYNKKVIAPSDSLVLTISLTAERNGYVSESVFLETDSKNQSRVPVRVSFIGVNPK